MRESYDEVSAKMSEIFYKGFTDEEILNFESSLGKILENLIQKENEHGQQYKRKILSVCFSRAV